ncbi:MAG: class I SAM-dependent methyltransferase [bacterium]|nr:class I SAM-dependent methyltransferase [bacterium]MCP5070672.1 class I SAM-dependent methyltransferase [bacterium]
MSTPSSFLLAHENAIRETRKLGPCLDLACGRGRQALAVARWGLRVVGIDQRTEALLDLADAVASEQLPIELIRADLEGAPGLPVAEGRFGCVLVFRYLHRPLAQAITNALRPGGLLLYETFTDHQRDRSQGPRSARFLLSPNELQELFPGLSVEHYWEGDSEDREPYAVAQLAARR